MTRKSTTTTKIHVTSHHIGWALQEKSTLCAVALALRDANDDWVLPRVTQDDIRYTDRRTNQRVIIPTPPKVAQFIDRFDAKREYVGPITFELDMSKAVTRPMKHLQPSQVIAQAERDGNRPKHRTTQKKIPASMAIKNTNKRERRPVEITGLVD